MLYDNKNMQMQEQKENVGINQSLMANNMVYKLPKSLTNSVSSTSTKQFFQKRTYRSNETAICLLNTGSDFPEFDDSYLFHRVKLIAPGASVPANVSAGFGVGSAINLIKEIKISSRAGAELGRIQRCNLIANVEAKWTHSQSWLDSIGTVIGFGSANTAVSAATEVSFAIPLSMISGFFSPKNKQQCPPMLASGLQIEILWEDVRKAFVEGGSETGEITDYEISDLYILTKTVTKQDSVLRSVTQTSASSGLSYLYDRYFSTTDLGPSGSTSLNIQLQKAVSFAKQAVVVAYDETKAMDITEDSFVTLPYDYTSGQFRVGSLYLPQAAVASSLNETYGSVLGYMYTQKSFGKLFNLDDNNSVTLATYQDGSLGTSCLGATLEKSNELELSGLSLNNSRILSVDLQFNALAQNTTFLTYIRYDGVAMVYLNNAQAKE